MPALPRSRAPRPATAARVRRRRASFAVLGAGLGVVLATAGLTAPSSGLGPDPAEVAAAPAAALAAPTETSAQVEDRFSAGGQGTCRVTLKGEAACVGDNFAGQLGDGSTARKARYGAVEGDGWAQISTSGGSTCGIKTDGTLWCWGQNTRGQLGIGNKPQQWVPIRLNKQSWRAVSVGWLSTCAVRDDGTLWCWGSNRYGQLGAGDTKDRGRPVQVGARKFWTDVAVGGWHACGIRTNETAACFGLNDFGQLGAASSDGNRTAPAKVRTDAKIVSIDAGWSSTCALSKAGAALCWGLGDQGQLGDGTNGDRSAPVEVAGGKRWSSVSIGDSHACGRTEDGRAWCWGSNRYGQLGTGSTTSSAVPVRVLGGTSWRGIDAGWMHTCGLVKKAKVQCWGNNEEGQLGRGDRVDRTTPPGVVAPQARRERASSDGVLTTTSLNALDSVHTRPGGGALWFAPGRIRAEWASNMINADKVDVVGFQELSMAQADRIRPAIRRQYEMYPAPEAGWQEVLVSVAWRKDEWTLEKVRKVQAPYLHWTRTIPMVRLRNTLTGERFWFMNTHNSPGPTSKAVADRRKAIRLQTDAIAAVRGNGVPVVFLGDLNERTPTFCTVTRRTDLVAVNGGRTGKNCTLPADSSIDWTFVSPDLQVRGYRYERSARTQRITDHAVLTSRMVFTG